MERINILVTAPRPLRDRILSAETLARMRSLANVTLNEDGHRWTGEELAARLPGVDAVIATWGMAKLTPEVLAGADRLRIVAYAAGSVKYWVTDAVYDRGIVISHAASRIAGSVADYAVVLAMMGLRRPQDFDRAMKSGVQWPKPAFSLEYEISGKKVGLLGFGYVGRHTASLFNGLGADVYAHDPYFPADAMREMNVQPATLDEILAECKVVSVHLPITDDTHHMIGARELALLQDRAVFVNTARSWVVDQDALLAELQTGRIWAALDVFDKEPLAADHSYRKLDNVMLSPHVAGLTRDADYGLTEIMLEEVVRLFEGVPLRFEVTRERLATMA